MKRSCLFVIALAACSSSNKSNGVLVDAPPKTDAPDGSGSNQGSNSMGQMIPIDSYGSMPTFVAYRAGSGAWMTPTLSTNGYTYEIEATADYVFVAVCTSTDGSIDAVEVMGTVDDVGAYFSCQSDDTSAGGPTVAVTGTMKQVGNVQMYAEASSTTAPWNFTLNVPPSITSDLFALGSASMAVQRSVAVGSAATQSVGTIDLSTQGTAYTKQPITVTGTPDDDTAFTEVFVQNQQGFATISIGSDATSLVEMPSSLMTSGDAEYLYVEGYDETTSQSYESNDPTLATYPMLPVLQGITFSGTTASWTTLPQADVYFDQLYYENDAMTVSKTANVQISPNWLSATGATSVAFDDSATGWQPAWSFWTSVAYTPFFQIEVDTNASQATSAVNAAPASMTLRRDRLRHHTLRHRTHRRR
jgi:hypothetical protein